MKKELFGLLADGTTIERYSFGNEALNVSVITYGAAVQKLVSYGRDVVGGFDMLDGYLLDNGYHGAIVGRYANRIRDARFILNNKTYELEKNVDGRHHLHSGSAGFSKKVWKAEIIDSSTLMLTISSADGDGNYPGNLKVNVTYSIKETEFSIKYFAVCDADTPLNLTNHSYFNLDGFGGTILDHHAVIHSNFISEIDEDLVPTGKKLPVAETVFDFNSPHTIGERIKNSFDGYDHNYFLIDNCERKTAATVWNSDRKLTVITDRPCVQFYIANSMTGEYKFKNNIRQVRHGAFCLETQYAPYSIVSGEGILRAGCKYESETIFRIEKI